MEEKLQLLAARRTLLIARAAVERQVVIHAVAQWKPAIRNAERLLAGVGWVRAHLAWAIAGGVAIAASPTARRWLVTGWELWRAARFLRARARWRATAGQ